MIAKRAPLAPAFCIRRFILPRKAMSQAMPAAAQLGGDAQRLGLGRLAERHERRVDAARRRRVDQHRQPLDPGRPADRRRRRPAEALDQAVIAAAGDHRLCAPRSVGDEFEGGVAVIIEAAHQARVAGPGDPDRVEPGGHRGEEVGGLGGQEVVDRRRAVDDRAVLVLLAVEDAQRVLVEPLAAFLGKIGLGAR